MTLVEGLTSAAPYPTFTDEHGQQWLDLKMGMGSLLFGHGCPQVRQALAEEARRGWELGTTGGVVARWTEWVRRLVPCAEIVQPTASATEANMLAIRVARANTGREWIARFDGHYHGCFDEALAGNGAPGSGLHPLAASRVVVLDEQDEDRVHDFIGTGRFAAVIVEPGGGTGGLLPYDSSRLRRLRSATAASGTTLIFDESMTGFRWAPGGMQQISGVLPDLCVLSKVLTGGLPGGAVAGRRALLAGIAPGVDPGPYRTVFASTFAGHPMTAAAGSATLALASSGDAQTAARQNAEAICKLLNDLADSYELDWQCFSTSSVIHHVVGAKESGVAAQPSRAAAQLVVKNWARQLGLCRALRESGVLAHPIHMWISVAHDDRVLERLSYRAPEIFPRLRDTDQKSRTHGSG